jgi:type IV pilus assembly protein PilX
MISHSTSISLRSRTQGGAVLVVSLIILLVLTVLAVSMSQTARLQERMTGNMRDSDVAFQSAEAALRDGESFLSSFDDAPGQCTAPVSTADCDVFEPGALDTIDLRVDLSFWNTNEFEYGVDGTKEIFNGGGSGTEDPSYVLEVEDFVRDDMSKPPTSDNGRYFYRVTSQSTGMTDTARAVLQSTYAERY